MTRLSYLTIDRPLYCLVMTSSLDVSVRSEERLPTRALLLASGASFLSFLDVTITNLAVPDVRHDLGGSLADVSWIVTTYTVLFAALLAPAGRVADTLGRRRAFLAGMVLFVLASVLSAVSPSLPWLLSARAAQGIGAALVMPASLAFALRDTPASRRPAAISLWSASAAAAAAVGPALGGILVHAAGWRSLFLINVPLGALLVWGALRMPREAGQRTGRTLPDLVGVVALILGVAGLSVALAKGGSLGWFSWRWVVVIAAALIALCIAGMRSRQHPRPAIEVALWRHSGYRVANIASVLFGAALYPVLLAGVLLLVTFWHYSELTAGLAITPGALTSMLVGVGLSRVRRRASPYLLIGVGGVAMAVSAGVIAVGVTAMPNFWGLWFPSGLLLGVGIGLASVGVSTAAALSAPTASFASATGLNIAARQIGGAVGLAVLAACLGTTSPLALDSWRTMYWIITAASFAMGVGSLMLLVSNAYRSRPRHQMTPTTAAPHHVPDPHSGDDRGT